MSENGLGNNVKVSLYRSIKPIEITENHFNCVKKNEKIENSNDTKYFETCEEKDLGLLLEETTLNGGQEDIVIGRDSITILKDNVDITKYYYVVVEFINQNSPQNEDMNRKLVGKVSVELIPSFESDFMNNIETVVVSKNESWDQVETFSIHVISEKYNIVSMSEDLEHWEELETKEKEVTLEKTYTSNGTYTSFFQDEAGNVSVATMNVTKVDIQKPTANLSISASNNIITIDASESLDNETEIKKYYYSLDGVNFEEFTESQYSMTDKGLTYGVATEAIKSIPNIEVFLKVEDKAGNISEIKKATKARSGGNTSSIAYDGTADNNLRYIGANPNNYVRFNNELWRIIGVMNNIDDGSGKKETRIKLIRNESIGNYSWDTSTRGIYDGSGVNEWSQADIMKLLNNGYESEAIGGSLYWNSKSGTCYNGRVNSTGTCNFTSTGLKNDTKKLFDKAVWNLGTNDEKTYNHTNVPPTKFYELERSSNTGKNCTSGNWCNDNITRTIKWTGYVGLMHPSDYGYATSGGNTTNRATCLNTALYNWANSNVTDCKNNDWLYKINVNQWTLNPFAQSPYANGVWQLYSGGNIANSSGAHDAFATFPTLYLKSNVKITSGIGTSNLPFQLELTE